MTSTKRITKFRLSWTADHEQYFQGHGIADQDYYTHCATGANETLREALKDAFEDLAEQDIKWTVDDYKAAVADLQSQVKEPEMLDMKGHNMNCECNGTGVNPFEYDNDPDCAVCAGEWHFYVMIDVKVEEGQ